MTKASLANTNYNKIFCSKLVFFVFFLLLFCNVSNAKVIIENTRPRLLVNQSDVERIGRAVKTYSKNDFKSLCGYANRRLTELRLGKLSKNYDVSLNIPKNTP